MQEATHIFFSGLSYYFSYDNFIYISHSKAYWNNSFPSSSIDCMSVNLQINLVYFEVISSDMSGHELG